MAIKVERLPQEPIIIIHVQAPSNPSAEMPEQHRLVDELIAPDEKRVFRITDLTDSGQDFSTQMQSMGYAMQGEPGSTFDPRIVPVFVGPPQLVNTIKNSYQQEQYGGKVVHAFADMDEALDNIRRWM